MISECKPEPVRDGASAQCAALSGRPPPTAPLPSSTSPTPTPRGAEPPSWDLAPPACLSITASLTFPNPQAPPPAQLLLTRPPLPRLDHIPTSSPRPRLRPISSWGQGDRLTTAGGPVLLLWEHSTSSGPASWVSPPGFLLQPRLCHAPNRDPTHPPLLKVRLQHLFSSPLPPTPPPFHWVNSYSPCRGPTGALLQRPSPRPEGSKCLQAQSLPSPAMCSWLQPLTQGWAPSLLPTCRGSRPGLQPAPVGPAFGPRAQEAPEAFSELVLIHSGRPSSLTHLLNHFKMLAAPQGAAGMARTPRRGRGAGPGMGLGSALCHLLNPSAPRDAEPCERSRLTGLWKRP